MKKLLIVLITAISPFAACADEAIQNLVTKAAVSALYVAGDEAQKAVTSDVCEGETFVNKTEAGDKLAKEAGRQYGHVRDALNAAYDSVPPSDESLEAVRAEFCEWASER